MESPSWKTKVSHAESLGISNYRVYLMDKYGDSILGLPNKYHYILDNNPSSYAPHRDAMHTMLTRYMDLLEDGGAVVTDTLGCSITGRSRFRYTTKISWRSSASCP